MSPLQCAATVLLARHAEAEYDGRLTPAGARQVDDLAASLRSSKVARVYASDAATAASTAEVAAGLLGVQVVLSEGLRGRNDAETEPDLLVRVRAELQEIADQHPGETVLVVSHAGVLDHVVPHLALNLPSGFGRERPTGHAQVVEAAVDADGWRVRSWGGRSLVSESDEYA